MSGIKITIAATAGSAPRAAGTQMMVWPDRTVGTIGGGALEWQAMAQARRMLGDDLSQFQEVVPLGPGLGQCCGGSVTLHYERAEGVAAGPATPLWIYGAGHVGRALVGVMSGLPDWQITWVDTGAERFPDAVPSGVDPLVAQDPARAVALAPDDAEHLILTYSHQLDLEICHAILSRPFAGAGLIGSATKWARFRNRLAQLGHDGATIARIACPIGQPELGKHPQAIAIGVASAMLGGGVALNKGQKA